MLWLLEDVFAHDTLADAARRAGHVVRAWDDAWWTEGLPSLLGPLLFRGSLENADRLARRAVYSPGAYCHTAAFACSAWYGAVPDVLIQRNARFTTAQSLVHHPPVDLGERVFVRPDSPLKPFAGRVVEVRGLTLAALDHGFYYDDEELPVVVAPVRSLGREWRYVVVGGRVVAGSAYDPSTRAALPDTPGGEPWQLAASIASRLPDPDPAYVLDLAEADGELGLLELNPFSGADLYACDRDVVVREVAAVAREVLTRGV
ncbi:MAG: ATP-grasp domain-containing protein [Alphaproteobacteria bacterium]|nr:ATP-grasp domain-containing protein [Alphaproteobacteria bacterium]